VSGTISDEPVSQHGERLLSELSGVSLTTGVSLVVSGTISDESEDAPLESLETLVLSLAGAVAEVSGELSTTIGSVLSVVLATIGSVVSGVVATGVGSVTADGVSLLVVSVTDVTSVDPVSTIGSVRSPVTLIGSTESSPLIESRVPMSEPIPSILSSA
jgi:hypothetical protein